MKPGGGTSLKDHFSSILLLKSEYFMVTEEYQLSFCFNFCYLLQKGVSLGTYEHSQTCVAVKITSSDQKFANFFFLLAG